MRLTDLTDQELMNVYYEAVECQDGTLISQCKSELNARGADE